MSRSAAILRFVADAAAGLALLGVLVGLHYRDQLFPGLLRDDSLAQAQPSLFRPGTPAEQAPLGPAGPLNDATPEQSSPNQGAQQTAAAPAQLPAGPQRQIQPDDPRLVTQPKRAIKAFPEQLPAKAPAALAPPPPPPVASVTVEKPVVQFFDTKSSADSVVYVVDRSGSMTGARLLRALDEVKRSVGALTPTQKFYVLFFSDGAYPMLDKPVPRGMPAATDKAKKELIDWLRVIYAAGGTFPEQALQDAARLKPDVIYLLSDGIFDPLSAETMGLFRQSKIKVYTIALEDQVGAAQLQAISSTTGGTYRFIPQADRESLADLLAAMKSRDVLERLDAVNRARASRFDIPAEFILLLSDPDDRVRQAARGALTDLAEGLDYGPRAADAAAITESVALWQLWLEHLTVAESFQNASLPRIHEALAAEGLAECWGAVTAVRRRNLAECTSRLLALLDRPELGLRIEVQRCLAREAKKDLGPANPQLAEEWPPAIQRWRDWWQQEQDERAQALLKLARQLESRGVKGAAKLRYEDLIAKFPDSRAATEAKIRLKSL